MRQKKAPRIIEDIRPPKHVGRRQRAAKFPELGATLSPYAENGYLQRDGQATNFSLPQKRKHSARKILKRTALTLVVILLATGGWLGWKFSSDFGKIFGGNVFGLFSSTKLKGEDQGRVTILLAGDSADDPGHQGADLTDSIMIVSIDTRNNSAFLLSVPRDLYVNIPGNGSAKINAAYEDGQADNFRQAGYPNGGMGLLEKVVNQDFGIPIDYYVLIDYGALRDAVNAVGGITVNIQSSDPRGLYDPSIDYSTGGPLVDLSNGLHTLDGQQALDLARARGDAYGSYGFENSDFERTQNQRLMLVALKNKVFTTGVLANPIKLGDLLDSIGNNVTTDFKTTQARQLYQIGSKIKSSSIQSLSLQPANSPSLLTDYMTEDGQSALIPAAGIDNYSAIQAYVTTTINQENQTTSKQ